MTIFRKREKPTENIAFMGISAGIVVAISLLSTFVPLSSLFVILFLPLVCALTTYYCEDKYLPFYIVGTIGVALLSTVYDLSVTLFDVTPAVFLGSFFGFLLKKNIPNTLTIFILSLLKVGLNYLMILLLKGIYGVDIIQTFIHLFSLEDKTNIYDLVPAFVFAYALIQVGISFVIISFTTQNLITTLPNNKMDIITSIIAILILGGAFGLGFVLPWLAYLLGAMGVYLSLASSKNIFRKNPWWVFLILAILLATSFYLSAFFYAKLEKGVAPLLFLSFFASVSLCSCISSLSFKEQKGEKA